MRFNNDDIRISSFLQLCNDSNLTIASLDEASEVLAAHVLAHADGEAARFRDHIKHCTTHEAAAALANTFRNWAVRKRFGDCSPELI